MFIILAPKADNLSTAGPDMPCLVSRSGPRCTIPEAGTVAAVAVFFFFFFSTAVLLFAPAAAAAAAAAAATVELLVLLCRFINSSDGAVDSIAAADRVSGFGTMRLI